MSIVFDAIAIVYGYMQFLFSQSSFVAETLQQLFRGNSVSEFDMKWRHWRDDCERRLEAGEFATSPNLDIMARVGEQGLI